MSSIFGRGSKVFGEFSFVLPEEARCLLSLNDQTCPIWTFTWVVHSDLEGTFLVRCLRRFRRRLQSGQKYFRRSCVIWLESHPTYSGVSDRVSGTRYPWGSPLFSCCWVFDLLIDPLVALIVGSRSKVLPDSRGFPKFSEGLLRGCEQCPRKFNSCLLFFSSWDEEIFVRLLPIYLTGFFV